jgi:EAL domain-containing protein (putative c-di-GMP-specific phosphodiesterase class I)
MGPGVWAGVSAEPNAEPYKVLVVDDELVIVRVLTEWLSDDGLVSAGCHSGAEAVKALTEGEFDVVVADVHMPEMDGVQMLRTIRETGLDLPVILMTGAPDLNSATKAVEYGALKYLMKPIDLAELRQAVLTASRLRRLARAKQAALDLLADGGAGPSERASLEASFDRMLAGLWVAYQPIVRAQDRTIFGYEALVRSTARALGHPAAILDAAERLKRLDTLGRAVRDSAARAMLAEQDGKALFVNLHPRDLLDETLFTANSPLASIASRVVLEITERMPLDEVTDLPTRVASLRQLGFRIAIDDLGAGYAGLTSLAMLEPDVVKLDMSLVRDIDQNVTKQRVVRTMIALAREMSMLVVAEGIETEREGDVLVEMGCDLLQGFWFAKPSAWFAQVTEWRA